MKALDATVLIQAIIGMITISFVLQSLAYSRHSLMQQNTHTHAAIQLKLYELSVLNIMQNAIAHNNIVIQNQPQTYDDTHPLLLGIIKKPYAIKFNLVALSHELICIELHISAYLPDNLIINHYSSALFYNNRLTEPRMPCQISFI